MGAGLDNRTVRNRRFRGFPGVDDEPEINAIDADELCLREWAAEDPAELAALRSLPSSMRVAPWPRPTRANNTARSSGRLLRRSGRGAPCCVLSTSVECDRWDVVSSEGRCGRANAETPGPLGRDRGRDPARGAAARCERSRAGEVRCQADEVEPALQRRGRTGLRAGSP